MKKTLLVVAVFLGLLFNTAFAPATCQTGIKYYLDKFQDKITEFKLDNGLSFLVIERHKVPILSFVTFVDVGSVNEKTGQTGISHLLEHMAFKGTKSIGTRNWKKEKQVLKKLDRAYKEWRRAKLSKQSDSEALQKKRAKFEMLKKKAGNLTKPNEFSVILKKNGANNLNAGTSADATLYFCSLPANRAELWFNLESQRLMHPVFREFYTEKEVVLEERRMRVESSPTGKLMQAFQAISYLAHPYGQPIIGWTSDIELLTKSQLREHYREYYVPRNITIAIAGDIDPQKAKDWAKLYFGSMEKGPAPPRVTIQDPEQEGRRSFGIKSKNYSKYIRGYHAVKQRDPDFLKLDMLGSILSQGRTSRLYSQLVREKSLAAKITAFNGFPGDKFPSMFVIYAIPNHGVDLSKLAEGIDKELRKVKNGELSSRELERAKTKYRADLLRKLDSNMGLAKSFAQAEGQRGDWKKVFSDLKKLKKITLQDIKKVANKYLIKKNSVVGKLINTEKQPN